MGRGGTKAGSQLAAEMEFESMSARLQKPYYFHLIIEKYI
jgi:hypothetical protein